VRERLRDAASLVGRRRESRQDVLVVEVGERPVADVVEQAGDAERLDHQPLRGSGRAIGTGGERIDKRRVELAGPEPRLVHDAQAMREP
jgi:hypothetical protein